MRIDRIKEKQYENLRFCIRKNLINPILGEDYYNNGQCVYSSDEALTEDIRDKFIRLDTKRKFYLSIIIYYNILCILLFIIVTILIAKLHY